MLGSSDLSGKKICVTVFLDELFEELQEETHEHSTGEGRYVDSGVTISEEPPNEQVNIFTYESQAPSEYDRKERPKLRPRKCRQQSKFGKLKNNLPAEPEYCKEGQNKNTKSQEFDAQRKPSLEKPTVSKLLASLNKSTMTSESFLSQTKIKRKKVDREVDCSSNVLVFTKSTQFDSADVKIKKDEVPASDKEQQTDVKDFKSCATDTDWLKENKDDEIKHYDLRSILESYNKIKESLTSQIIEDVSKQDHLFIASSSEQISNMSPQEVIRIWSTCIKVWNENLESDMSEVEYLMDKNKVAKHVFLTSDPKTNSLMELEKTKNYTTRLLSYASSDPKFSRPLCKNERYKQETKSAILEVSGKEETRTLDQTKLLVIVEPTGNQFECRSRNFAEGDTFEELSSNNIHHFDSKENLLKCNKILSQEPKEAISNKTKEQFLYSKILKTAPRQLAEVFIRKKNGCSDTESETVFAENPDDAECFEESQVIETEDTISKTKFLKRIKTAEILGGTSAQDIKNLSADLIFICDDVTKENMSVEPWKEGESLFEMKEVYLKDSKESTMYLIEIPLHLISSNSGRTP